MDNARTCGHVFLKGHFTKLQGCLACTETFYASMANTFLAELRGWCSPAGERRSPPATGNVTHCGVLAFSICNVYFNGLQNLVPTANAQPTPTLGSAL